MTQTTVNFLNNECFTETWAKREMSNDEAEAVKKTVCGYKNVTVTGVRFCDKGIEVWLAVNYLSRAKYPNNHREYQEFRSFEKEEWKGWF